MSRKNQKQMTPEMIRQAVIGSFIKLNPLYMMKNPVMFVVEVGFFITLILSVFPGLFGDTGASLRTYNVDRFGGSVCHRAVCQFCRVDCRRTGQGAGSQSEKDPEGYQSPPAWQRTAVKPSFSPVS